MADFFTARRYGSAVYGLVSRCLPLSLLQVGDLSKLSTRKQAGDNQGTLLF